MHHRVFPGTHNAPLQGSLAVSLRNILAQYGHRIGYGQERHANELEKSLKTLDAYLKVLPSNPQELIGLFRESIFEPQSQEKKWALADMLEEVEFQVKLPYTLEQLEALQAHLLQYAKKQCFLLFTHTAKILKQAQERNLHNLQNIRDKSQNSLKHLFPQHVSLFKPEKIGAWTEVETQRFESQAFQQGLEVNSQQWSWLPLFWRNIKAKIFLERIRLAAQQETEFNNREAEYANGELISPLGTILLYWEALLQHQADHRSFASPSVARLAWLRTAYETQRGENFLSDESGNIWVDCFAEEDHPICMRGMQHKFVECFVGILPEANCSISEEDDAVRQLPVIFREVLHQFWKKLIDPTELEPIWARCCADNSFNPIWDRLEVSFIRQVHTKYTDFIENPRFKEQVLALKDTNWTDYIASLDYRWNQRWDLFLSSDTFWNTLCSQFTHQKQFLSTPKIAQLWPEVLPHKSSWFVHSPDDVIQKLHCPVVSTQRAWAFLLLDAHDAEWAKWAQVLEIRHIKILRPILERLSHTQWLQCLANLDGNLLSTFETEQKMLYQLWQKKPPAVQDLYRAQKPERLFPLYTKNWIQRHPIHGQYFAYFWFFLSHERHDLVSFFLEDLKKLSKSVRLLAPALEEELLKHTPQKTWSILQEQLSPSQQLQLWLHLPQKQHTPGAPTLSAPLALQWWTQQPLDSWAQCWQVFMKNPMPDTINSINTVRIQFLLEKTIDLQNISNPEYVPSLLQYSRPLENRAAFLESALPLLQAPLTEHQIWLVFSFWKLHGAPEPTLLRQWRLGHQDTQLAIWHHAFEQRTHHLVEYCALPYITELEVIPHWTALKNVELPAWKKALTEKKAYNLLNRIIRQLPLDELARSLQEIAKRGESARFQFQWLSSQYQDRLLAVHPLDIHQLIPYGYQESLNPQFNLDMLEFLKNTPEEIWILSKLEKFHELLKSFVENNPFSMLAPLQPCLGRYARLRIEHSRHPNWIKLKQHGDPANLFFRLAFWKAFFKQCWLYCCHTIVHHQIFYQQISQERTQLLQIDEWSKILKHIFEQSPQLKKLQEKMQLNLLQHSPLEYHAFKISERWMRIALTVLSILLLINLVALNAYLLPAYFHVVLELCFTLRVFMVILKNYVFDWKQNNLIFSELLYKILLPFLVSGPCLEMFIAWSILPILLIADCINLMSTVLLSPLYLTFWLFNEKKWIDRFAIVTDIKFWVFNSLFLQSYPNGLPVPQPQNPDACIHQDEQFQKLKQDCMSNLEKNPEKSKNSYQEMNNFLNKARKQGKRF